MVHLFGDLEGSVAAHENISRTHQPQIQDHAGGVNPPGQTTRARPSATCSFVVADWRQGSDPFCGAPTRRRSSYCARHGSVCIVSSESVDDRSRAAVLIAQAEDVPEPPPELAYLRECVLPELLPDDISDLRALLDHQPLELGAREPE
jgi:hypothetical protein